MDRPRLFLVPMWIDIEWSIRPQLEEWAEVATWDPASTWLEQGEPELTRHWLVNQGLAELDRLGWDDAILASDAFGNSTSARIAGARPEIVRGLAHGHASLSWDTEGERAPMNGELWAAMGQLLRTDYGNFIRSGLAQLTQGSFGEDFADEMLERVPVTYVRGIWDLITRDHEPIGELLSQLDCRLLFVKHDGCLMFPDEGFDDATSAFPRASLASTGLAPSADPAYATALESFAQELGTES